MLKKICEHTFLADKLNEESVVVDLGANKGEFGWEVYEDFRCKIYAIEPVPELFESIKNTDRMVKILGAITTRSGTVMLSFPLDRCATLYTSSSMVARAIEVNGYTLQKFLSMNGIRNIDLLKVDIEGAEVELFENLTEEEFGNISQYTVEFHDFLYPELRGRVEKIKKRISSFGFYCIPFSLTTNGDVLFVRKNIMSFFRYCYLRYFLRYVIGGLRKLKKCIYI